jgi:hypothetical protein
MLGKHTRADSTTYNKLHLAESLISLDKIDILVLTETHTLEELTLPEYSRTLCHSGISLNSAGIAMITHKNSGWYTTETQVLIPGHAIMNKQRHSASTEEVWILGVYARNSQGNKSLKWFYNELSDSLADFISRFEKKEKTPWPGCFMAGDFNLVEHEEDRYPLQTPTGMAKEAIRSLIEIKNLCRSDDEHEEGPRSKTHTYFGRNGTSSSSARLDRIYVPSHLWTKHHTNTVRTTWSDHLIVKTVCTALNPRVQIAKSAPRLSDPTMYLKNRKFWKASLNEWKTLTERHGPVKLAKWTELKQNILSIGQEVKSLTNKKRRNYWRKQLEGRNWMKTW